MKNNSMNKLITSIAILGVILLSTTSSFGLNDEINTSGLEKPIPFTVDIMGQGKPILYLPGFATPGSIWKETVENITLKRKSYLISYAGFNGNEPIEMPWYDSIKSSLIKYIQDNNLKDIIIIGHSMGGNLAVDIASELPGRTSKIIIVEALPCMREVMMPNVSEENLYYESPYNKQMLEMDEQQFKNMASMIASNMTLDKVPDVEIAQENYQNQYSKLSNKTIVMAFNSKHFIMFDQPEWFYATVNDFLDNEKK